MFPLHMNHSQFSWLYVKTIKNNCKFKQHMSVALNANSKARFMATLVVKQPNNFLGQSRLKQSVKVKSSLWSQHPGEVSGRTFCDHFEKC